MGDKFQAVFATGSQNGSYISMSSKPEITAGEWTHLATTITPENVIRLYLNGKLVVEKPLGDNMRYASWTGTISIGNYGILGNLFAGELTGLRWWSRAATPEEISTSAAIQPDK
jgi:hypothetical protein